jgi:hypothetical protein
VLLLQLLLLLRLTMMVMVMMLSLGWNERSRGAEKLGRSCAAAVQRTRVGGTDGCRSHPAISTSRSHHHHKHSIFV